MKILVVEDERNIREAIVQMIGIYVSESHQVFEAESVKSAVEIIPLIKPDVLFLDIQLRDGSGFDVLSRIAYDNISVVFITAYEQFAIKAFKYSALDYLLKPLDPEELIDVLNKVENKIQKDTLSQRLNVFLEHYQQQKTDMKIMLRTADTIHIVKIEDILYCEAAQSYTTFYLKDGEQILVSKPIGEYENMIDKPNFIRVHQSFLVNMDHVIKFEKEDSGYLITSEQQRIPVSVRKKSVVLNYLEIH